jgi:hypothetical protein
MFFLCHCPFIAAEPLAQGMADQSGRHARRECSARGGKWHLGCFVVSAVIFQHGTCRLLLQLDISRYIVELVL